MAVPGDAPSIKNQELHCLQHTLKPIYIYIYLVESKDTHKLSMIKNTSDNVYKLDSLHSYIVINISIQIGF